MSAKAKIEAIIYATEEPVTLNQLCSLLKDNVLAELAAEEHARLALNELVPAPTSEDDGLDEESIEFEESESTPLTAEAESAAGNAETQATADAATADDAAPAIEAPPAEVDAKAAEKEELKRVKERVSLLLDELIAEYSSDAHGVEIRQIAGGYRMATKPEHHDVLVNFAKSLKPPIRLSLQALETLSVIAYKQPVTVPEISEVRGVDSAGVIATLLDRKLITTAGRKQVIGRPILYKTTKEFLLRFGLNDVNELPSMEEFEKLGDPQAELFQGPEQPVKAQAASESEPGVSEEQKPVSEADPALTSAENSSSAVPNEPERFNEAVAPLPGVETLDRSSE